MLPLGLPLSLSLFLISVGITFVITSFYRFLVNQDEIREVKEKLKEKQTKMKEIQKTNPNEYNQMMNEILILNNKHMRMNMKPILAGLLVVFIFLPYVSEAYGDRTVRLNNSEGSLAIDGNAYDFQISEEKITLGDINCKLPCSDQKIGDYNWNIYLEKKEEMTSVVFSRIVAFLPFSLPFFGSDFGWVAWYLILSFPLSQIFKTIMGVEI